MDPHQGEFILQLIRDGSEQIPPVFTTSSSPLGDAHLSALMRPPHSVRGGGQGEGGGGRGGGSTPTALSFRWEVDRCGFIKGVELLLGTLPGLVKTSNAGFCEVSLKQQTFAAVSVCLHGVSEVKPHTTEVASPRYLCRRKYAIMSAGSSSLRSLCCNYPAWCVSSSCAEVRSVRNLRLNHTTLISNTA